MPEMGKIIELIPPPEGNMPPEMWSAQSSQLLTLDCRSEDACCAKNEVVGFGVNVALVASTKKKAVAGISHICDTHI